LPLSKVVGWGASGHDHGNSDNQLMTMAISSTRSEVKLGNDNRVMAGTVNGGNRIVAWQHWQELLLLSKIASVL